MQHEKNRHVQENYTRLPSDFSEESLQTEKGVAYIFKILKEQFCNLEYFI